MPEVTEHAPGTLSWTDPGGRFAVVADPHGAHFGLLSLSSAQ
jgi:predicted enzyme related to lactoylglutathione lyase